VTDLDITVAIPSIPPRMTNGMLARALESVHTQTFHPHAHVVAIDRNREGAARTRQRALESVRTPWVAFLDDDDAFMPTHLLTLAQAALATGADYVYSWFEVIGPDGRNYGDYDPVFPPGHFTDPWDPSNPRHTTMTILVRTDLAQMIGFQSPQESNPQYGNEDWRFTLACNQAGAKIHHVAARTWYWHHSGENTSGLPKNW
jgi:Glycosyl transferase family 2